jgi:hypothetical protein
MWTLREAYGACSNIASDKERQWTPFNLLSCFGVRVLTFQEIKLNR